MHHLRKKHDSRQSEFVRFINLTRLTGALFIAVFLLGQGMLRAQVNISSKNWGTITAPVYNSSETVAGGAYSAAELFAGPNEFGSYYAGVLPNGRKVTPAGTTIQIGMNPLGIAVTSDGKFLITTNDDERETNFASYHSIANLGGYSISVIDATAMSDISQTNVSGKFFVGLQVTGLGPYTVWASGGGDNNVKIFNVSESGQIRCQRQPDRLGNNSTEQSRWLLRPRHEQYWSRTQDFVSVSFGCSFREWRKPQFAECKIFRPQTGFDEERGRYASVGDRGCSL